MTVRTNTLENMEAGQLALSAAPAENGGFLETEAKQSGNIITPTDDELTRLPLPLFVTAEMLDEAGPASNHHHAYGPKTSPALGHLGAGKLWSQLSPEQYSRRLEGKAVRNCRVQVVPYDLHIRENETLAGPPALQTRGEKFTVAVLACAGVVPREAIELLTEPGTYTITRLSHKQHEFIADFSRMHFVGAHDVESNKSFFKRERMAEFFAQYAIEQSIQDIVSEPRINEFLNTPDEDTRHRIGYDILSAAINEEVAQLVPIGREAEKEGMAPEPVDLHRVVAQFFLPRRVPAYSQILDSNVRTYLGIT